MLKIGLTGGIGSGKTTVADIFSHLGIPVYYSDAEAKALYFLPEVKEELQKYFGESIFNLQQEIDIKILAQKIFNDTKALNFINEFIHPLVKRKFNDWCEKNAEFKYVIIESAILFESGFYENVDEIIFVSAPETLRISRIIKRDHCTEQDVLARMKQQLDEEKKKESSDYIIYNDEKQLLIPQVLTIHEKLK